MKYINFFKKTAAAFMIAAISFTGCDDDNPADVPAITIDTKAVTLAAEGTQASVPFVAAGTWTAGVAEADKVWLTVTPAQGNAGVCSVNISAAGNFTGSERKADVTIASGDMTVAVTVTQPSGSAPAGSKKITFRVQRCNEEWTPFGNKEPYIAQSRIVITVFNAAGEVFATQSGADGTAEIMLPEGDYTYKAISEDGMSNTFPSNQSPPYIIGGMVTDQDGINFANASLGSLYPADINYDAALNGADRANAAPLTVSADASVDVYVAPAIFTQACSLYNRELGDLLNKSDYRNIIYFAYGIDASLTHEYNAISSIYNYHDPAVAYEGSLSSLWRYSYDLIYGCNTVLRYMDEIPDPGLASGQAPVLTEEQWETFASAVRYYRAYAYYTLLNYYGGVPITDALRAPITAPRNTAKEVEDFIIAECDFVAANAPAVEPNMAFAARQVKARVLMRNDNFQGASEALSGIIDSYKFSLPAEWGMDAMTSDAAAYLPSMMMKGNGVYPVRYTETLLLYVEAQLGLGTPNQEILDWLNQLIAMQGGVPVNMATPAAEIRAAIRNLWATELSMEGHTFAYLKRTDAFLAEMRPYGASEFYLLMPIPASARSENPKLDQNIGWPE